MNMKNMKMSHKLKLSKPQWDIVRASLHPDFNIEESNTKTIVLTSFYRGEKGGIIEVTYDEVVTKA